MNQEQVVSLMESSKSEDEWNDNADRVKAECDGYPHWWYGAIVVSGLAYRVSNSWKK